MDHTPQENIDAVDLLSVEGSKSASAILPPQVFSEKSFHREFDGMNPSCDTHSLAPSDCAQCELTGWSKNLLEHTKPLSSKLSHCDTLAQNLPASSKETEEAFMKLVPVINSTHKHNFGCLLAEVLRECDGQVPLDELFTLLYEKEPPKEATPSDVTVTSSSQNKKGLQLCHLVLDAFKTNGTPQGGFINNPKLSSITFHEVSRTFLAMAIIFACLKEEKDQSLAIPRTVFYKAYYIMCQKLIFKSPCTAGTPSSQQTLILNQSGLGRVMKSAYPNLVAKRLGKRGESKAHYIGIRWKESMMDEETLRLIDLELPKINDHFGLTMISERKHIGHEKTQFNMERPQLNMEKPQLNTEKPQLNTENTATAPEAKGWPLAQKPVYSFIDVSSRYPDFDFSPRFWIETPNSVPQHSEWARDIIENCRSMLGSLEIHLDPVERLYAGVFFKDCFQKATMSIMEKLVGVSASRETFLHFYLAVILLLFPSIIASDKEVSRDSKLHLRHSIKACIHQLEIELAPFPCVNREDLTKFTRILSKLTVLNEMTSCSVKKHYESSILTEMLSDLDRLGQATGSSGRSVSESSCIKGITMAMNAYNIEPFTSSSQPDNIVTMQNVAKTVSHAVKMSTKHVERIKEEANVSTDIPFKVFMAKAEMFHRMMSLYPEIHDLPMIVSIHLVSHFCHEMQNASFQKFGKKDPELCKETFKSWWVFSAMFQEYVTVISEVVGLSQTLDSFDKR
ncbi:hypothetical protein JCM33374_g1636 [Metschnikowia sp. JCM 33374]|nr:hypothetical protein JCM33374_g1636 [Metschnikowia sp. JCM 33374]